MDICTGLTQEQINKIYEQANLTHPLAEQQRKFVVALFDADYNATEAIKMAGYKGNAAKQRAWQYMQEPKVRKAIELMAAALGERNLVRQDYVLRKMIKGAERAEDEGNLTAMARFLEMIGKHLGMFSEKIELTGKDGAAIQYEQRVQEDVDAFKGAIDSLSKREGKGRASSDTKH